VGEGKPIEADIKVKNRELKGETEPAGEAAVGIEMKTK